MTPGANIQENGSLVPFHPRNARVERAMRTHFGFDCGAAYEIEPGLFVVGERETRYACISVNTASNRDLLNGIDVAQGFLLVRSL